MSSFPERLLALAESSGEATLTETVGKLEVHATVDRENWNLWSGVADEGTDYGIAVEFFDDFDQPLARGADHAGRVKILVAKPNTATEYHAFLAETVARIMLDPVAGARARRILVARGLVPFQTESCDFDVWVDGAAEEAGVDPMEAVEVQRLVSAVSPATIPARVGDLLLRRELVRSAAFDVWQRVALGRLPLVLVNEVRAGATGTQLLLRLPRLVSIEFAAPADGVDSTELFRVETLVARWIFAEGVGVENRHAFFTAELGRIWNDGETWGEQFARLGPLALDGAKSANNLFLSGKTGEVLKSLGDLRKTMGDETARVHQQSRDLSSALWRDFVIAVTALSARAAVSGTTSASITLGVRMLSLLVIVFLVYSAWFTISTNRETLANMKKSRAEWCARVYRFVSDGDMAALVTDPASQSDGTYTRAETRTLFAYGFLILVLFVSVIWQDQWLTSLQQGFDGVVRAGCNALVSHLGRQACR